MEALSNFFGSHLSHQDSFMGQLKSAAGQIGDNLQKDQTKLVNMYEAFTSGKEYAFENGSKRVLTQGDIDAQAVAAQRSQAMAEMFSAILNRIFDTIKLLINGLRQ